nr:uncharacterized protein LOC111099615 isoform X6 [Crassostrea virginica]
MPESDADPCTSHAQEDLSTFAEPQIISIKENTASDYATTTATVELPENLREKGTEIRNQKKTAFTVCLDYYSSKLTKYIHTVMRIYLRDHILLEC